MGLARRLGQLCPGSMFVTLGSDAVRQPGARPDMVAQAGIRNPELSVRVNGAAMTVAGLALALNRWPRLAALALIGSLVPTTLAGHAFWKSPPGPRRAGNLTQFLKNLGPLGGLLAVVGGRTKP